MTVLQLRHSARGLLDRGSLRMLSLALPLLLTVTSMPAALAASPAPAGSPASAEAAVPANSRLDAPLFYQLIIGELELRQGEPATAFAVLLDAARRTREKGLFERAVEIALRAQAGNEALSAANAWRQAHPASLPAVRAQVRILLALNRLPALGEPLRKLIDLSPEDERPGAIAALPRLLRGHPDPRASLQLLQSVLIPLAESPATRTPAQLALARALMQVGQNAPALALARDVSQRQPEAPGPALIALELLPELADAQALLTAYLAQPKAEPLVRLSYAQWLALRQRHGPALVELRQVVQALPDSAQAWFQLGAVLVEAQERTQAESALKRFLELQDRAASAAARARTPAPDEAADTQATPLGQVLMDEDARRGDEALRNRALLLLSQLSSERGDYAQAQKWLEPLDEKSQRLEVQARRALILARQGKIDQARALIRAVPEQRPADALNKILAEAQMLRTVERWRESRTVLAQALERHPQDVDVLYELAMVLERLGRHDEMERHLRRIIELKPDHAHAHNALGYSLAERGIRLEEAHALVERALELAPEDPFITDSLAWVAFRQGKLDRAEQLLRQAYTLRPDTEIGAHLGEVLWVQGQRDAARRIWRESRDRDGRNKVLRDTLARLKVDL